MIRVVLSVVLFIVAAVAVVAGIGMVLPREYQVERSVTIAASPEVIYEKVSDIETWPEWTYWNDENLDDLSVTYGEITVGKDASQTWTSKQGNGSLVFAKAEPNKLLVTETNFEEFPTMFGEIQIEAVEDGNSKVTWTASGAMPGDPMSGWFGLFMPSLVGRDYDYGLNKLKESLEPKEKKSRKSGADESDSANDDPEEDPSEPDGQADGASNDSSTTDSTSDVPKSDPENGTGS